MKLISSFAIFALIAAAMISVASIMISASSAFPHPKSSHIFRDHVKSHHFHDKKNFKNCLYTTVHVNGISDELAYSTSAAAGLLNRNGVSGGVYTIRSGDDQAWQTLILDPLCSTNTVNASDVIITALGEYPRVILYDSATYNYTLPSVTTMAGVLSAVPLSSDLYTSLKQANPTKFSKVTVALDTVGLWSDVYEAVNYTIVHALSKTQTMSWSAANEIQQGQLVDLIIGGGQTNVPFFAQGLPNACLPFTKSNAMLQEIVKKATQWPRPIKVIGYNSEDPFAGGDTFEAETGCFGVPHVMGQVASSGATNLMFWSKFAPFDFDAPRGSEFGRFKMPQVTPGLKYNASKKYVALTYGDMDNIAFVLGFAREHVQYRGQQCRNDPKSCFPFTWTLSPHVIEYAPAIARFYRENMALSGGLDSIMLPPSGYLYSYPGMMPADGDVLENYVKGQHFVSSVYDTTNSIHWEWLNGWPGAFNNYFPLYVNKTDPDSPNTKNFFLLTVPWPIPELGEYNRFVGDKKDPSTNVFTTMKRFVWQQGGGGGRNLSPVECARLIEKFPTGSASYVYIIQNTPIQWVFQCVHNVTAGTNVEFVSASDLGDLARQKAVLEG